MVIHGGRPETVDASVAMSSAIWPKLQKLFLTENMRLSSSIQKDKDFAEWIGKMSYVRELNGSVQLKSAYYLQTQFNLI